MKRLVVCCIIFVVCTSISTHTWDITAGACVCVENHYETTAANDQAPAVCTACPTGTTTGVTNSQEISACCKYCKIIILIPDVRIPFLTEF